MRRGDIERKIWCSNLSVPRLKSLPGVRKAKACLVAVWEFQPERLVLIHHDVVSFQTPERTASPDWYLHLFVRGKVFVTVNVRWLLATQRSLSTVVFSAGRKGGARRGDARPMVLSLDRSHEIVRFVDFNVVNCDRSSPLNILLVKPVWFVRTEQLKRRCHAPYFRVKKF